MLLLVEGITPDLKQMSVLDGRPRARGVILILGILPFALVSNKWPLGFSSLCPFMRRSGLLKCGRMREVASAHAKDSVFLPVVADTCNRNPPSSLLSVPFHILSLGNVSLPCA